jgi:hypothetical protein
MKQTFQLSFLLLLSVLSGCASTSPSQNYRPAGASSVIQIGGNFNELTKQLQITFNGNQVMTGSMPLLGSSVDLAGTYENKPVSASCFEKSSAFSYSVQCLVFVNGEKASTLVF